MCSRNAVTIIACLVLSIFLSSNALAQSGVATTSTSAIESGTLSLPAPTQYFNDYADITSAATQTAINDELADFDKQNATQVVVVIFKKKDASTNLADYCTALFNKWGIGQKDNNHGLVLFVFVDKHLLNITSGPGIESVLPDKECQRIIDHLSLATFRKYRCGTHLSSAVDAMLDGILIYHKPKLNGEQ